MYKIELSTNKTRGKCVKEGLDKPFRKIEIPKNATFYGEATIGSNAKAELGVNVKFFGGDVGDGKTIVQRVSYISLFVGVIWSMMITNFVVNNFISDRYYVTVTEEDCIPVHENFVSKKYGVMHTRLVRTLFTSLFDNVNVAM